MGAEDQIETIHNNHSITSEVKQENVQFCVDPRKERNATMSGENKVFQQAVTKKQIRIECEHDLETEIVAPFSVSHAESSNNKENSHISEGSCGLLVFEYEPEISRASTLNYKDYIISNSPRNLINDSRITSICNRLKTIGNAATMIVSSFIRTCGGELDK